MTNVVSPNKKKPSPDWITPQAVVDVLNLDYRFTLDPAASRENAKCPRFYTREDDGLSKSWAGERVFCNPPYGAETPAWVEKGVREYRDNGTFSAFLIVPRTDTAWFHEFCSQARLIYLLLGRVPFIDPLGERNNPQDPSCLVIFDEPPHYEPLFSPQLEFWDWKKDIRERLGEQAALSVKRKNRTAA
jgi:site-specific DNA-methyltransferase (adenine-specific)